MIIMAVSVGVGIIEVRPAVVLVRSREALITIARIGTGTIFWIEQKVIIVLVPVFVTMVIARGIISRILFCRST